LLRVYVALVVALISISWAAPLVRLAGVSGPIAAWWRLLIGWLVTFAALAVSGGLQGFNGRLRNILYPSLLSGAALAGHFALWFESLRFSSIVSSTGIVVAYPLIIGIYEALVDRVVSVRSVFGVLLSVAGVSILSMPWSGASLRGSLLSFLAAVLAAVYFLLGRRLRVRGISTLEYTFLVYLSAFLVIAMYDLAVRLAPLDVPRRSIPYLVALGLVPMIGGHTMLNYALAYMPATTVTTVALLEPYGASLIGWLVLGEKPSPVSFVGVSFTVMGAYIVLKETLTPRSGKG
jgi:drug/metabolite transporter (DMT)-like permease